MQNNRMKRMLPYLLIALVLFYGVPGIGIAIGGGQGDTTVGMIGFSFVVLSLVVINPVYYFVSGLVFCLKNGFCWYYPVLLVLLFAPVLPAVLQSPPELVYIALYAVVTLAGNALAWLIQWLIQRGRRENTQKQQEE